MMRKALLGRQAAWAVALVLLGIVGCGKDENESGATSGGGVGANTPLLWNDVSSTGGGPAGDTPLLWNDPNTATFVMGILDPTDIRTYTYPDIYILGNRHPLMTDVNAREFPVIITLENQVRDFIFEWRISEYERLIGIRRTQPGFPRQAFVSEYGDLRRNARAHCKHYAVHFNAPGHNVPDLPLQNAEGDRMLLPGAPCPPPPCTHTEITAVPPTSLPNPPVPNNTDNVAGANMVDPGGRLIKSFIDVNYRAGQLVGSGTNLGISSNIVQYWTSTFPEFLLQTYWTHFGIGYWAGEGSPDIHYWNLVAAENPRVLLTGPEVTIILF
ncbi:MAG TPA: hypothetical protein VNO22_13180 [Planctomycetota bacterium]|jgi:hypothetical protein|nr:hypothetical protein [Planctomycetota bacterium]